MQTITKLSQADFLDLFKFETKNRDFFEKSVPSRGADYYTWENFQTRNFALLAEQAKRQSFFYLLKDDTGTILGRANLVDINWQTKTAELGYRIDEGVQGKGLATFAVVSLAKIAHAKGLQTITAYTTNDNLASSRVLEKAGFRMTQQGVEEFEFNQKKVKFIYFAKQLS